MQLITMLSFTKSFWDKFVICGAIALIGFGTYNLSVATFAQQESPTGERSRDLNDLLFTLVDHFVGQVGPIVGGAVTLGISFVRKHGLKISAEAEEYFVNSTKSFVENQTRFLYKQIKENPQYAEAFSKGIIPPDLGKTALGNVVNQLEVELRSDEFTKTAEEDHKEKNKIIDEVLDSITTTFDAESILFSDDVAKMHIKSELNKRIGSIRSSEDKVA